MFSEGKKQIILGILNTVGKWHSGPVEERAKILQKLHWDQGSHPHLKFYSVIPMGNMETGRVMIPSHATSAGGLKMI